MGYKMKFFVGVIFALAGSTLFAQTESASDRNGPDGLVDRLDSSGINDKGGVRSLLGSLGDDELISLKFHDDLNVSLFAAWLSCKNECEKIGEPTNWRVEQLRCTFLGFFSGRILCPLPDWWQAHLMEIGIEDDVELPHQSVLQNQISGFEESFGVTHDESIRLGSVGNQYIEGELDGVPFKFCWDRDQNWSLGVDANGLEVKPKDVVACFAMNRQADGKVCFATTNKLCADFDIVMLDASGDELWRTTSSNFGQIRGLGGLAHDWNGLLEIKISSKRVFLFGVSEICIYLDVLDAKTGNSILSFKTLF
jgi:hypothetical protein